MLGFGVDFVEYNEFYFGWVNFYIYFNREVK